MASLSPPTETLIEDPGEVLPEAEQPAALRLLVFGPDSLATHPLPEGGEVVIGRASDADIRIDVPSISRRHAVLRLGRPLEVEDLGSANGTRVRDSVLRRGDRSPVQPGDTVELGSVTLILQRVPAATASASGRPRRLWTHGYFEARLEEECERAEASRGRFAVLRVGLEGTSTPAVVQDLLASRIGSTDLIAAYGPGDYELLLFGCDAVRARGLARDLEAALRQRGAPVRIGTAAFPDDGRTPERLTLHAGAPLEPERRALTGQLPVIVEDPQMRRLHELVKRVAQGNISVLLMGETGVGKEVFAEAIHKASARAEKPFLRLNCAALSETLLESELFGHEKGAFTGAVKSKPGLLETASGGTVLLDELGELPMAIQVKLLRVLEQREVMRVGDVRTRPIDVRFIGATNRDLEAEVKKGTFRQDLFFRLNGFALVIPPLRERVVEIEGLARMFISQASRSANRAPEPSLSPEALSLLQRYAWPGNIRELRNVLERAVLLSSEPVICPEHLPIEKMTAPLLSSTRHLPDSFGLPGAQAPELTPVGREPRDTEAERHRILEALERCGGNQTVAARMLGISRRTLLNRLDTYAIPRPRKGVPRDGG